ncbi:MAG: aminotransferase class V-fold PLP-dependent enzyme [Candidatus Spechtbacterales bacterium]
MKSKKSKQLIMTGDLSNVPQVVSDYIMENYDHHRTPWVEGILENITNYFRRTLGEEFKPLILTCTGTNAKEAIVSNLAEQYTILNHISPYGQILDIEKVSRDFKRKNPNTTVIVDLSVSFGADKINFKNLGVDGAIIIPERALMGIPGLSIVAVKGKVLDLIKKRRASLPEAPYFLDLLRANEAWEKKRTTPYSPNTSAAIALSRSLEFIEINGGLKKHNERHAKWASIIRDALNSMNVKPLIAQGSSTSAFTVFTLPRYIGVDKFVYRLEREKNIIIEKFAPAKNSIKVGHTGYLDSESMHRFLSEFREVLLGFKKDNKLRPIDFARITSRLQETSFRHAQTLPSINDGISKNIFSIPAEEFRNRARDKAKSSGSQAVIKKIQTSSEKAFRSSYNYESDIFKDRVIGFIGAGNTVRYSVQKCLKLGMKNIIIYSPSLAQLKKSKKTGGDVRNHKVPEYWESLGVKIALTNKEVFLRAHTVVLLPTFYDRRALKLFAKPAIYLNKKLIGSRLLRDIKLNGKMDLLINSSAREGLVDRGALSRALAEGWLTYFSDEFPSPSDPLLPYDNSCFSGHVGGSCALTLECIALNTHKILRSIIKQILRGGDLQRKIDPGYTINLINEHLRESSPWRSETLSLHNKPDEIRVLLTDTFDMRKLDFESFERLGAKINLLDISRQYPTQIVLKKYLKKFRPHILMIRTRAEITKNLMKVAKEIPEFAVIVRPGVGVDNMYDGMREAARLGVQIINEPLGNSFAIGEMTMHFILNGTKKIMLTPGPTKFNPEVFQVMHDYAHPRSEKFKKAHKTLLIKLGKWMGSRRNFPIIISGPSTAFMEAAIVNLTSRGDRGLVISHGKFGDRFIEISEAKKRKTECMKVEDRQWGKAFSPKEIAAFFKNDAARCKDKISFLCLQQNETSSGVAYSQNQIKSIVHAARRYNPSMMIIVDAVSGLLAMPLDFDSMDIDAMIVGSQKSFGVASVIAYMCLSRRALKKMTPPSLNQMVNVFHILSTLKSLKIMEREGGKATVLKRHADLATMCRKEIKKMGLTLMSRYPNFSDSVTPIILPKNIGAAAIRRKLESLYGISIAEAQSDYWKGSMIRIGHFGYVNKVDMARCLRALRILIREEYERN